MANKIVIYLLHKYGNNIKWYLFLEIEIYNDNNDLFIGAICSIRLYMLLLTLRYVNVQMAR